MKKLLGLALALAISSSAIAANAEILKNLKTTGEITVLGVMDNNVTDLRTDNGDNFRHTRAMINYGVMFDLLDDLHANMTFIKADRFYGQNSQHLNTIQANVFLEEANVQLDKVADLFNVKIGRQFYGDTGDINVFYGTSALLEEAQGATGLDAVRVDLADSEKHNAHLIWAKTAESAAVTPGPNDDGTSFWGIRDDYKLMDDMNVGGYVYNRTQGRDAVAGTAYNLHGDNLYVFGVKANGQFMGFGYAIELAANAGKGVQKVNEKTPTYSGYAYTGKVNYKLDTAFGGFNPRAMFAYGSGDSQGLTPAPANKEKNHNFVGINPDFRPGLIFGMSDLAGAEFGSNVSNAAIDMDGTYYNQGSLANLTVLNIGVDYMPKWSEKLTFMVDFFNYKINKVNQAGSTLGDKKNLGSEIDITANYKFAENVNLGLAAGRFMPGDMIKTLGTANNAASKLASYINVKW